MTVALIDSLAPIRLTPSVGSAVTLATESVGLSTDIIAVTHHHSGNMSPTAVLIPGATPRFAFSIPWDMAFSFFGLGVKKVIAMQSFLTRFQDFVRAPGAVHTMYRLQTTVSPNAIAAAQISGFNVTADGVLMAQVELVPLSGDGFTHPVERVNNNNLLALSGSPILHTLGPAYIQGAVIPGVTGCSGQLSGQLTVQRVDGDKYPKNAARLMIAPTINLSHSDPDSVLASLGLLGVAGSSTLSVYFKEYDPTTGETNDAGGAYRIDVAISRINPSGFETSEGVVASTAITVHGIAPDGGTHPFAVTANVVPPVP